MEITEVRIMLRPPTAGSNGRLCGYASIVLDDALCIKDIRIIEGQRGFVIAMPSRKLTDRCGGCGGKNALQARYCSSCGRRLDERRAIPTDGGRALLHADLIYPINGPMRAKIQEAVLLAYADELDRSREPGYVGRHHDLDAA